MSADETTLTTAHQFGTPDVRLQCAGKCSMQEYIIAVSKTIATLVRSVEDVADTAGGDRLEARQLCIDLAAHMVEDTDWDAASDLRIVTTTKPTATD